ncbi:MAG TPA: c-type cytochrome [Candidatus Angelobacter sp.]|nr:c-type cytochrome [Candidatus Angelobacter sp.]
MRKFLFVPGALLLASLGALAVERGFPQDKAEPKMTPEDVEKKNPIAPTAEGLAEARKLYGYDCAMCHGKQGDGKGDLAADMKLELHDWRDPASLEKMTDGELFFVISNGRGKMVGGEGDRSPEKMRWNLVNLVRSFAKKGAPDKPKPENPQP